MAHLKHIIKAIDRIITKIGDKKTFIDDEDRIDIVVLSLQTKLGEKVSILVNGLNVPVGFHAHNNLGLAIANSITAITAGAKILDGTARGFGAGAGNAQLEVLVAVLAKQATHKITSPLLSLQRVQQRNL